jgi:hypothetical protein
MVFSPIAIYGRFEGTNHGARVPDFSEKISRLVFWQEGCEVLFMIWIRRIMFLALASVTVTLPAVEPVKTDDLTARWEFACESGALWRVGGGGSQLDYVILPQLLTWKTPAVARRMMGGRELVMRSRFSVLLEPVVKGPESYFLGGSASGLLEWWTIRRTQAFFFSSGGGIGLMDSQGYEVVGGQGQDFNFNWFIYAGSRFQRRNGLGLSVGVYFQHISNTGLDPVNPGINALGPMLNVSWRF